MSLCVCSPNGPSSSPAFFPSRMMSMRFEQRMTSSSSLEMNTTLTPFAHISSVSRCISAFAPTSMPRVGSSRMRTSGSVAIQRARITFCWLPPESSPTFFSASGVAMPSILMYFSASSCCSCRGMGFNMPLRDWSASMMFSRTVRSPMMPSRLRSSGQKAMFFPIASEGDLTTVGLPLSVICPCVGLTTPNRSCAVSVRPEPSRPAKPIISPFLTVSEISSMAPGAPSLSAASITSAPSATVGGFRSNILIMSLPIIAVTSSSFVISSAAYSPTRFPFRSTVIRSEISNT
ncbi:MAG: hypothetical protein BWY81_01616 [Firmicutes bacterium ADurb.Bin467]|nr:MAG: hypothetical protein BWY81_01616 [Firmicutes bacterium ADurb.Bin467]